LEKEGGDVIRRLGIGVYDFFFPLCDRGGGGGGERAIISVRGKVKQIESGSKEREETKGTSQR